MHQSVGPADGGGGKSSSAASKVLKYDDLPDAIDPKLRFNNVYLIFTPYDKKKLEFSLYTNDTIMYHRYEPVVNGEPTRVPPGLIFMDNLEKDIGFSVARYLKMFGLALGPGQMVPNPRKALQKPFAVKITNENPDTHDRLILARLCGPQISKPLVWTQKTITKPFNANIGFVEWAMLHYNRTTDIRTSLAKWRIPENRVIYCILSDRNQAFVFDIKESKLTQTYRSSDVDLVATVDRPVTGRKKRKEADPALLEGIIDDLEPGAPGGSAGGGEPAATATKSGGAYFTSDRPPRAAPSPPPGS